MRERLGCMDAVMVCSGRNLNFCINIQTEMLKMAVLIAKGNFPQDLSYRQIRPSAVESQSRAKGEDAQSGLSPPDAMKK